MKFLFINSFYPPRHYGGADIQVYQLANKLAELGHECYVVFDGDASFWKNKNESNAIYSNHANVHFHGLKSVFGKFAPISSYITGIPTHKSKIKKIIEQEGSFDVIHYHNLSYIGQNVIQYGNAIKLYTEHTNWLKCPRGTIIAKEDIWKKCEQRCIVCAFKAGKGVQLWRYTKMLQNNLDELDMIIAPSRFVRDITSGIVHYSKIRFIPNFAEEPPTENKKPDLEFKYFLYVGAIEKQKGIIELMNFYNKNEMLLDNYLIVIGDGSLRHEMFDLFLKSHKSFCYGNVEHKNIYKYYKHAEALIIPSIGAENAPLVALEAMSVGTPIIVSDVGGLPEIANKIDPKLVYHNDSELLDLLYDFDKSKYSDKAKQVYEQNYTIDKYVEQYLKLVESCSKSA